MNDNGLTALVSLVRRTRNRMWRQRLLQSLWRGSWVAAAVLLILAIIHVAIVPVTMPVWLPCALVPPVLAALPVVLLRRPSAASAAAELDRRGAHDDLLLTAWEMLAMPPDERPLGARVVLHQAGAICPGIQPPQAESAMTPWRGRYGAIPLTALIVALFLLQLPTPRAPAPIGDNNVSAPTGGSRVQPTAAAERFQPQEQPGTDTAANARAHRQDTLVASAGDTAAEGTRIPVEGDPPAGADAADSRDAAPSAADGADADPTEPDVDGGSAPVSQPGEAAGELAATAYADIERAGSADSGQSIAGTQGAGLSGALPDMADPAPESRAANVGQRLPAPYTNRFSLTQRLQIRAYFDRLEDTP